MIAEGKYTATAKQAVLIEAKSGNNQVAVECEIDEGEIAGATINYYGSLTDAALEYTVEALRNMGWQGNDVSDLSSVVGQRFQIIVRHKEWEGKTRAEVRFVNRLGGVANLTKLDDGAAKSFAARMAGRIAALSGGQSKPAATAKKPAAKPSNGRQAPHPNAPPVDDSDLPF